MTLEPALPEDRYTALFAVEEEALVSGASVEARSPVPLPGELQQRLERDLACVHLLRRALRRPIAIPSTPGVVHEMSTIAEAPIQVALAPGAGSPQHELQGLLRKRLRFISLVILAIYLYFLGFFGLNFISDPGRYLPYLPFATPGFLAIAAVAVSTAILWTKRPLSLRPLRGIELTLFGLVLMTQSWEFAWDLFRTPPFAWEGEEWMGTSAKDRTFLWIHSHYMSLPYIILIVTYATLIPSSWRRCTLVVGVMAATPVIIGGVACVTVAESPSTLLSYYVVPMSIYLGIAVAIAAYGTHRIEVLRQEAFEARKLGQYQLKRLLGSGGMGEVYLAEHRLLKQPCAIKLIRPERAGDSSTLRRFEREVQATSRLKHWNTVQIYDYGNAADGTFYYVMEYLPGPTLEELVQQHGPLSPGRVVHLLRQVCLALREAHDLGLIHRDIKPANILICERGGIHDVVKVVDFGLVKNVALGSEDERLTREGAIAGTPAYMSPEQAAGKDELDARSDIYSLGALAYFLVIGQPPFLRSTPLQTVVAHLCDQPTPPAQLRAEVPADLQAIILRCLEKDPARRFADVGSLQEALAACSCAGEWTEALAAGWWTRGDHPTNVSRSLDEIAQAATAVRSDLSPDCEVAR